MKNSANHDIISNAYAFLIYGQKLYFVKFVNSEPKMPDKINPNNFISARCRFEVPIRNVNFLFSG